MRYKVSHIVQLREEVSVRCTALLRTLETPSIFGGGDIAVDASRVRIVVDDFKSVLTEIRRLK